MERDLIAESLHPDSGLSQTAQRVARFIHANRALALASSAADLAQRLGTSDATVIRSVQAMGFDSLSDLRRTLIASLSQVTTPASALCRTMEEVGPDLDDAVSAILRTNADAIHALQTSTTRAQVAAAVRHLHPCTRIAIFGIGPSGGLADYVCRVLNRNGRTSFVIGTTGRAFADDLVQLRPGDGVAVMAYGTLYREIAVLFQEATRLSLPIVLITDRISEDDVPPATVIVSAMRGKEAHVALHAATVAVMEAIAFALSIGHRDGTIEALDRLNQFRRDLERF
ncbi:transcriptional regulator [Gluconacetobacter johannae DSM 13595]|uniref:MurR/RpiR family transcriptional regulator n=1 Tax=Gluconacetobacter johannae TaxID=112140 RepID=A0A7W4J9M7_9PROT|nr:MurR/RpiR family transcriptional regulator [Gluconacetobacter johannae]MBB2177235.1 MurR/RpiR family transcriptional regulator [Gluconacetobacter johannae]GBQ81875.1 transcriptional regulator [Gluconacetobacter johannae DSM 13595]